MSNNKNYNKNSNKFKANSCLLSLCLWVTLILEKNNWLKMQHCVIQWMQMRKKLLAQVLRKILIFWIFKIKLNSAIKNKMKIIIFKHLMIFYLIITMMNHKKLTLINNHKIIIVFWKILEEEKMKVQVMMKMMIKKFDCLRKCKLKIFSTPKKN